LWEYEVCVWVSNPSREKYFYGGFVMQRDFHVSWSGNWIFWTVCWFEGSRVCEAPLFDNLLRHPKFLYDNKLAIAETFQQIEQDYLCSEINHTDAASTAYTRLLARDHFLVANIGDSRAVLNRAGEAVALSTDETPYWTDERKRIEDAGGVVVERFSRGKWIEYAGGVGGFSRVSHAFGARSLKQYVVADPEIQEYDIEEGVDFLVLANGRTVECVVKAGGSVNDRVPGGSWRGCHGAYRGSLRQRKCWQHHLCDHQFQSHALIAGPSGCLEG
jgi:hypothetical protein